MATIQLPPDFKEFLQLLNSREVEYLVVGRYAVGSHGYPRATADLDVWIATTDANAEKLEGVLREFGFNLPELSKDLFLEKDRVIRMGLPPIRIKIPTSIPGKQFHPCYTARRTVQIEGVKVDLISLEDLKTNKKAAGRHQDLSDLDHLA